jgi:hypothetical protein
MGGHRRGEGRQLVHGDELGAARWLGEKRMDAAPGFRSRWLEYRRQRLRPAMGRQQICPFRPWVLNLFNKFL